jgi:hypothetical protein
VSQYASLLGKRVEARYRAGYIYYSATGTLTLDTGRSVYIEEHFSDSGRDKMIRVEVPYECILSLLEVPVA